MKRGCKLLLLVVVTVLLAAAVIVPATADPIHVPGGPRFTLCAGRLAPPVVGVVQAASVFTPIHVPGGP